MRNEARPHLPADLLAFLADARDAREYRRALAVKLVLQGYEQEIIAELLGVSDTFVSQMKTAYTTNGVAGLQLQYRGSESYLTDDQRVAVTAWLKTQPTWSADHLRQHLRDQYQVTYKSDQSLYALLAAAGMTYKKTQATNPKADVARVAAKKKS